MTHEEAYKLLGLDQGRITIGGDSRNVAKFMEALAYAQDVLLNTDKIDHELELQNDEDVFVLVCVSGVSGSIRLERALELTTYNEDDGWCLEWGSEKDEINQKLSEKHEIWCVSLHKRILGLPAV